MSDRPRFVAGFATDLLRGRAALVAENALGLAARLVPAWRSAVLLVQPATILRWHRAGFRVLWRRRSRPGGRPPTGNASLIRLMAARNPRWGAERIRGELLKLGIRVAKRTVQKYMRRPKSPPSGIAVDATSVYWTNPISGTVMKLPK